MPLNILAAALTMATPTASAAPPIQFGLGVVEVFEERKPTALLRAGGGPIVGEVSGTYNPSDQPSPLTSVLASITGGPWIEDREIWTLKALADLTLPAQDTGWYGAPHLYVGAQGRLVQRNSVTTQDGGPVNSVQAAPPTWQLSPLLGVGISASYGPITARATLHAATAPKLFTQGREFTHRGSLDLLYSF